MAAESSDAMQQLIDLEDPFLELQAVKEEEKDKEEEEDEDMRDHEAKEEEKAWESEA